ncbi:MAG: putative metalloprotease CJM1_0395 family protein [Gammaproteobacteria bacterium]|jgi:hypothetical protein
MNITTAAPASLPINTANVQTEVVQTQNRIAERIPEAQQTFKSATSRAAETGPGQTTNATNQEATQEARPRIIGDRSEEDGSEQQRSPGQERQEQREQRAEQTEIAELAAIDRKVRAHEQAHASVGGVYAGSPSYTYKTGPNGVRYAVGGEVSIDLSPVPGNPEATLRKAEQVARAALAPADPSPTDRRVAQAASALAAKARVDIARANAEQAQQFRGAGENDEEQGPQPFNRAGISLRGGMLSASLRTDATEQVGGQVSASA